MERSLEPAYLTLPGWRCVPVYALPLTPPPLSPHALLPPGIPSEPKVWTRQQVFTWLEWCVDYCSLPPVEIENFIMNGRGLCLLEREDFCERAPRSGDVLHNALRALLSPPTAHRASLPHERARSTPPPWGRSVSSDLHSVGHLVPASECEHATLREDALSPPRFSPDRGCSTDTVHPITKSDINTTHRLQLSQVPEGGSGNSAEKINVRLLWDFLQQLLNDPQRRYECCIVWKQRDRGVFKITDPQRLATLWGRQKNHLNMNFDKMSRALRYYYRVRILQKEPGERHCYRFLRHPSELRHCKQRSLLSMKSELIPRTPDIEAALDMSIKEEASSPE